MITKAGSKTWEGLPSLSVRPRLTAMERSLLKWAMIDRDDKVLDSGLGDGVMVDYLMRNMECEVCGVSDNMELVRRTRSLVQSADLVYAAIGDIPWRDGAFDAVFLRPKRAPKEDCRRQLKEINRVLKDGGQLIMGVESCPAAVKAMLRALGEEDEHESLSRRELTELLNEAGFEYLTWQRSGPLSGVLICWKHHPKVDELKQEA